MKEFLKEYMSGMVILIGILWLGVFYGCWNVDYYMLMSLGN